MGQYKLYVSRNKIKKEDAMVYKNEEVEVLEGDLNKKLKRVNLCVFTQNSKQQHFVYSSSKS